MRYLAIGDIHGYSHVLDLLLDAVKPAADDLIITLGDYVDRGPDSRGVLDRMVALHRTGRLVALRGNHDYMMCQAREGGPEASNWMLFGGRETLESYSDDGISGSLDDVPEQHWDFLDNSCVDWHEIDTHFFVHANVNPQLPLAEQSLLTLHWEGLYEAEPHCSGKIMVCGHTKQKSGVPRNFGCAICIDTWVYGFGWLTCLDAKSGHIWQANQGGEVREGELPEVDVSKEPGAP